MESTSQFEKDSFQLGLTEKSEGSFIRELEEPYLKNRQTLEKMNKSKSKSNMSNIS